MYPYLPTLNPRRTLRKVWWRIRSLVVKLRRVFRRKPAPQPIEKGYDMTVSQILRDTGELVEKNKLGTQVNGRDVIDVEQVKNIVMIQLQQIRGAAKQEAMIDARLQLAGSMAVVTEKLRANEIAKHALAVADELIKQARQ